MRACAAAVLALRPTALCVRWAYLEALAGRRRGVGRLAGRWLGVDGCGVLTHDTGEDGYGGAEGWFFFTVTLRGRDTTYVGALLGMGLGVQHVG